MAQQDGRKGLYKSDSKVTGWCFTEASLGGSGPTVTGTHVVLVPLLKVKLIENPSTEKRENLDFSIFQLSDFF